MKADERQRQILVRARANGRVEVGALAADLAVAEAIQPESPVTVVTSSLLAAGALADAQDVTVLLLGGRMRGRTLATVDHWALRMLKELVIDLAFLGANGISREHGLTTPDPAVAYVTRIGSGGGAM